MKILFCPCHYLYDETNEGSEFSWAFNIGDRISRRFKGSVVVTGKAQTKKHVPYEIVEIQRDNTVRNPNIFSSLRFNWLYFLATNKLIRSGNFDIIHHVLPFAVGKTYNLAWLLKKPRNARLILGPVQNPLLQDMGNGRSAGNLIIKPIKPALRYLSKKTLLRADKVVVIHEEAKNLVLNCGVPENNIEVIPPGIDVTRFTFSSNYKKHVDGKVELISVGSLTKRKGHDLTLKALKEVTKKHKNVKLTILGSGPEQERLEQLVVDLKLKPFVRFGGFVSNFETPKYYQRAHIFVSMSRSEGFATVCLEAMASGLAIISSKVGGFEEGVADGLSGYLVDQEDYKGLADRIIKLIDNRQLLEKFGIQSRKDAEKKYNWDSTIVPKYINVYKEALNGNSRQ
jgi:glycosyltransferase involved in cell wall biosynthesis